MRSRAAEATDPKSASLPHAVGLAACIMLPLGGSAAAIAGAAIPGFPVLVVTLVAIASAVIGAGLAVIEPLPSLPENAARFAAALLAAVAVRMTVPDFSTALAEVRAGEAPLLSMTVLVVLVMVVAGSTVGHWMVMYVTRTLNGAPTLAIARDRARRTLVVWCLWAGLLLLVTASARNAAGQAPGLLLVACALASLLLIADLRMRTPPAGDGRTTVSAAPRRVQGLTLGLVVGICVALTFALGPLLPIHGIQGETVAAVIEDTMLGWLTDDGSGGGLTPDVMEQVQGEIPGDLAGGNSDEPGELSFPQLPWGWIAGALVLVALVLLRPHRWPQLIRRIWAAVRRSRWARLTEQEAENLELDELPDDDTQPHSARRRGRRSMPLVRPRDTRLAVLHDYRRVERLLAREQTRARTPDETPIEHATRVHVARAHAELAELASAARFAQREPDAEVATRSRALHREIARSLR